MTIISIIGAGPIAEEHIKAFRDIQDVKIKGIYSRTFEKALKLSEVYDIDLVATSIEELFRETNSNLVVVAIPIPEVRSIIDSLCKYTWNIFLEKPAGLNYKECEYIYNISNQHKKKVFVGHNRRFLSSAQLIKKDLEEEEYRFISINDCQDTIAARVMKHPQIVIENWMYANSIHLIDLFHFFGRSEIESVKIVSEFDFKNPKTTISYILYKNGDEGLYQCTWNTPGPWACSITTNDRFYEMRPLEKGRFKNKASTKFCEYVDNPDLEKYKPGFYSQALSIVRNLNGHNSYVVTIKDSLETMKLIQSIYTGRKNEEIFF